VKSYFGNIAKSSSFLSLREVCFVSMDSPSWRVITYPFLQRVWAVGRLAVPEITKGGKTRLCLSLKRED